MGVAATCGGFACGATTAICERFAATVVGGCELFMDQAAKLLTDSVDGFLHNARFLIIDRDSKFNYYYRRAA
jgi:hypothetical protein